MVRLKALLFSMAQDTVLNSVHFTAKHSQLEIEVYTANLIMLSVDAIVCSSDKMLSFQAGAAKAIASKAGMILIKEYLEKRRKKRIDPNAF